MRLGIGLEQAIEELLRVLPFAQRIGIGQKGQLPRCGAPGLEALRVIRRLRHRHPRLERHRAFNAVGILHLRQSRRHFGRKPQLLQPLHLRKRIGRHRQNGTRRRHFRLPGKAQTHAILPIRFRQRYQRMTRMKPHPARLQLLTQLRNQLLGAPRHTIFTIAREERLRAGAGLGNKLGGADIANRLPRFRRIGIPSDCRCLDRKITAKLHQVLQRLPPATRRGRNTAAQFLEIGIQRQAAHILGARPLRIGGDFRAVAHHLLGIGAIRRIETIPRHPASIQPLKELGFHAFIFYQRNPGGFTQRQQRVVIAIDKLGPPIHHHPIKLATQDTSAKTRRPLIHIDGTLPTLERLIGSGEARNPPTHNG